MPVTDSLATVDGDLSRVQSGLVFQQVNAAGLMGAGLAQSLRQAYPQVYDQYMQTYQQAPSSDQDVTNGRYHHQVKMGLVGHYQDVKINDQLHVINSFSQGNLGRHGHFTNEQALIANLDRALQQAVANNMVLYVPDHVGAGLGGGNWPLISQHLHQMAAQHPGHVVLVNYVPDVEPKLSGQQFTSIAMPKSSPNITSNSGSNVGMNTTQKPYYMALTGHRPKDVAQYMNGQNAYDYDNDFWRTAKQQLTSLVEQRLREHPEGLELHSGMALGADTVWAQVIAAEKQRHPDQIRFVADVPLPTQAAQWPAPSQQLWQQLVNQADEVKVTSQGPYRPQVMELRNQQMINPSDETIAFWDGAEHGGTANGVRDAKNAGVILTQIKPQDIQQTMQQFNDEQKEGSGMANNNQGKFVMSAIGHRPNELKQYMGNQNVYDLNNPFWDSTRQTLENAIEDQLQKHPEGLELHSNLDLGSEMVWAQAIANVKQRHPDQISFVANVPYHNQESQWPDATKQLYQDLLKQADQVAYATDGDYNRDAVKQNMQAMVANNDAVIAVYDGRDRGQVVQNVQLAQNAGASVMQLDPQNIAQSLGNRVSNQINSQNNGQNDTQERDSQAEQSSQASGNDSASTRRQTSASSEAQIMRFSGYNNHPQNPGERTEFVMLPSAEVPEYQQGKANETRQTRYQTWRRNNVNPDSPVTVDELMRALSPAIVRKTNRNKLRGLLTSMSVKQEDDFGNINQVLAVQDNDQMWHTMSPSDVQTTFSVLRVLHDTGLDYDVVEGRDHSIALRLNDDSRAFITLFDPQEPQRVGEVRTRDNVTWGPELTRIAYQDENGDDHALAQGYVTDARGNHVPQDINQPRNDAYRYNERRLNHWNLRVSGRGRNKVTDDDVKLSREMALSRYEGLDQATKSRLALAPLVNALGIDPAMLSPQLQQLVGVGRYETIDRLSNSSSGYQAQINLGESSASISNVIQVNGQDRRVVPFDNQYLNGGNINLDLGSGVVIDNNFEGVGHNPVLDPNQMTDFEADTLVVNAYQTAREQFLLQLTGADLSGVDDDLGQQQQRFKRALANTTKVESLGLDEDHQDNVGKVERQALPPLDVDSQRLVLNQFKNGLLDAGRMMDPNDDSHVVAIDDSALRQARQNVVNSVPDGGDPILRARRVQAFDDVVKLFNNRFGNAPVRNGIELNNLTGLRMDQLRKRYDRSLNSLSDDQKADRLASFDNMQTQLSQFLQDRSSEAFTTTLGSSDPAVVESLSLDEIRQNLNRGLAQNGVNANDRQATLKEFDSLASNLTNFVQLDHKLNMTRVIAGSSVRSGDVDYEFKMAQALGRSQYRNDLEGNNDQDTTNVMERSIRFDESTAKTADELLAEDQTGHEAELQQYVKDVQSGKKQFSWDPAENPEPSAFKADGSGLIRPESPNHFKARALNLVKQRLIARGADPDTTEVKIDDHGVIHFKADVPLYTSLSHEVATSGRDFQRDENGRIKTTDAKTAYVDKSTDDNPRMQPIEGSIGQVFAPSHDGLIRTNYQRFDNIDPQLNQQVFLPRMRAWYQFPNIDQNGSFDMHQLEREQRNGLGVNNRLRIQTYDMMFNRELAQNVDNLIATRNIGDITKYNSTTLMSKLLHGEVLGNKVPEALLNETPSAERQAKLETQESAVKFSDDVAQVTKTTNVITFAQDYQKTAQSIRENAKGRQQWLNQQLVAAANQYRAGKLNQAGIRRAQNWRQQVKDLTANLKDPHWPTPDVVQNQMQNPLSFYGLHSIGEIAHDHDMYYFSDLLTGQGGSLGPLRYLSIGTVVEPSGRVKPNIFFKQDKDGKQVPVTYDGKFVGYQSGTPVENLNFFNNAHKSSFDRISVGIEQAIKGHEMIDNAGIANMAIKGWTTEDAMVISKDFAEKHQFVDSNGDKRPVMIGDKISDQGGNKATVAMVVDPDMDMEEARKQHVDDLVALFRDNPKLEVVMNGMSQLSRNNAGTTETMLNGESSKPMRFTSVKRDENGKLVPGEVVQTNATINQGRLIITDQTVDHKVTLYDQPGDKGRKAGGLNLMSDAAKNAPTVANYFRKTKNGILDWRRNLLSMGLDLQPDGQIRIADKAAYDKLIKEGQLSLSEFKVDPEDQAKLDQAYTTKQYPKDAVMVKGIDGQMHLNWPVVGGKKRGKSVDSNPVFDGINEQQTSMDPDHPQLTANSQEFVNGMMKYFKDANRSHITYGSDVAQISTKFYNAGRDFVNKLPDGGMVKLPEGLQVQTMFGDQAVNLDKFYVLPLSMRSDQVGQNGMLMQSNMNRFYSEFGTKLVQFKQVRDETLRANLANGDPKVQQAIDAAISKSLGIQTSFNKITQEASQTAFGGANPKLSQFNTDVLAGHVKDSVTSQVSSNPNLPLDVIEVSPAIAKKLGLVQGKTDDVAHFKGHDDWQYLHVHRDPIWREQGSLGFRARINPELTNVRINPIIASLMDGDFDGDNLGLIAMKDAKAQDELKNKCSVDQWMLDNNTVNDFKNASSLMNINAELVDNAVQTNNTYHIADLNGEVTEFKPFNHQRDANGKVLPLAKDDKLTDELVNLMGRMRDDVIPDAMKDQKGHFNAGIAKSALQNPETTMNDSDVLNMMVDNAVKNAYEPGRDKETGLIVDHQAAVKARHEVEKLIVTARGYQPMVNPKTGEIDFDEPVSQPLAADGIDYTDRDTMKGSLNRYIDEGAKGHPGSLEGLLEYMDRPKYQDVVALGKSQVKDGNVDLKVYEEYHQTMDKLHAVDLAVQKATKEKSDQTGVPGNAEKMYWDVLSAHGIDGLHVANALGQPGTQKILSIKRDPVQAGQVAELLQNPLSSLLEGKRADLQEHPTFMLMGDESSGRLGDNIQAVSSRLTYLHNQPLFNTGKTLFEMAQDPRDMSNDQVMDIAKQLQMKTDFADADQQNSFIDDFKNTLHEAVTPYVPVQDDNGKQILDADRNTDLKNPLSKTEFVNAFNYLVNDQMGMGVDQKNIEMLADRLADEQGNITSIKDASDERPDPAHQPDAQSAPLLMRIKEHGVAPVENQVKQGKGEKLFGEEGSFIREAFADGRSDEDFAKMLDLKASENAYAQTPTVSPEEQQAVDSQNEMLAQMHTTIQSDMTKENVDEDTNETPTSAAGGKLDMTQVDLSFLDKLGQESMQNLQASSVAAMNSSASHVASVPLSSDEVASTTTSTSEAPEMPWVDQQHVQQTVQTENQNRQQRRRNRVSQEAQETQSQTLSSPDVSNDNVKADQSLAQVRDQVQKGVYQSPFTAKVGSNDHVEMTSINQLITSRYLEKAYMAGVSFKNPEALREQIKHPQNVDDLRQALGEISSEARNQLSDPGKPYNLITKADTEQFRKEGFMAQVKGSKEMQRAFGVDVNKQSGANKSQLNQPTTTETVKNNGSDLSMG